MMNKSYIKELIESRVNANELVPCQFLISRTTDEKYVDEVTALFDKYGVKYILVDTVEGTFNLNRDWVQTDSKKSPILCAIEYCGAYPAYWDIDDVIKLADLEKEGKVLIRVYYIEDDKLVPNH